MTASPLSPVEARARERLRARTTFSRSALAIFAVLQMLMFAPPFGGRALAEEAVKGEVKLSTSDGYARLAFRLEKEVPASIEITYPVMVVKFKKPVAIAVDQFTAAAPSYISAARLDPDGMAIRIALVHKVKLNSIPAAERLYIDLLPETWSGTLPGLPQDVVGELAQRALDAERQLRLQRSSKRPAKPQAIRVKVATEPTFTRYVFAMPDLANVVPERVAGKLTLEFDQPLKWDLTDARAALPQTLRSIDADLDEDAVAVTFKFNGAPEVRTFREDRSIVVDVGHDDAKPNAADAKPKHAAAVPAIAAPETVPAKDAAAAPPAKAEQAPPQPPAKSATAEPKLPAPNPDAPVAVDLQQSGDTLRAEFPFVAETPAAVFQRADMLWLVFDSAAKIDLAALQADPSHAIRAAALERGAEGEAIVRLRLERPRLVGIEPDGPGWVVTIGDSVAMPSRPLFIARSNAGKDRASITIPFDNPRKVHVITDRDIGDRLLVVTALGPARGFPRGQNFVEVRALPSTHGVVLQPLADDVTAELAADKITVIRPGGLSLSSTVIGPQQLADNLRTLFDAQAWNYDRQAEFNARQAELIRIAAMAPAATRKQARFNMTRFYLAHDRSAEAMAVLTVALSDKKDVDDVAGNVLKAVADVMLERPDDALKVLSNPRVGDELGAPIWRAVAYAGLGKWPEAYAIFKGLDKAIAALPAELQRIALCNALRTAIEVRDFNAADRILSELKTVGVPPALEPSIAVLVGRLKEALGRTSDALDNYRAAAASQDRRAAAQGRLREILLRYTIGDMPRAAVIDALETLTSIWRGDEVEAEGLKLLAHLYTEDDRYRAAFHAMRVAQLVHPNSDFTRAIQDEATVTFDSLFLGGKADALPPIEALRRIAPASSRSPPARRRARAGRDPSGGHLSHEPQAGTRDRHFAGDAHRGIVERTARPAAAARGARDVGNRPPRPGAGVDRQYRQPRSGPAARRYSVGGAALAPGRRADRNALRRSLARIHAALGDRTLRRPARGDRLLVGRRRARPGAVPRAVSSQNGGYAGPPRLRFGERAGRQRQRGIPGHRQASDRRRFARGLPARHAQALSGFFGNLAEGRRQFGARCGHAAAESTGRCRAGPSRPHADRVDFGALIRRYEP
jgi:tetratricopeptide (TPR) repeat protein